MIKKVFRQHKTAKESARRSITLKFKQANKGSLTLHRYKCEMTSKLANSKLKKPRNRKS